MKTICLLFIFLCVRTTVLYAQVSQTVELTAGSLGDVLTVEELQTTTRLTLTGAMDARDFKVIRDRMPVLSILDLAGVTIAAFTDTTQQQDVYYPANTIPESEPEFGHDYTTSYGLATLPTLERVTLPATLTAIGYRAFKGCRSLVAVEMPASLTSIGGGAFMDCISLTAINIPASVSFLGKEAFLGCSSLLRVILPPALTVIRSKTFEACASLSDISLPASVEVIEYRAFYGCTRLKSLQLPIALKKIGGSAFEDCSALTEMALPTAVTTIDSQAFTKCKGLTSLIIPQTVTTIGHRAFAECTSLMSIYSYSPRPADLGNVQEVFGLVDKNTCRLFIPHGSVSTYAAAAQWKDFLLTEEMPEFTLSETVLNLNTEESSALLHLTTGGPWTVSTESDWLTAEPLSGSGNGTISVRTVANTSAVRRIAKITIVTSFPLLQEVVVIQQGKADTVRMAAGQLAERLSLAELNGITRLTIIGQMDARDFKVIRDRMPQLEMLDISQAMIEAYSGGEGTIRGQADYLANEIPPLALASWPQYPGKYNLAEIKLPLMATTIGDYAFAGCHTLSKLAIPLSVSTIGKGSFADCSALATVGIPSTVTAIGADAFRNCTGIITITLPSLLTSISEDLFFNCTSLVSIYIPDSVTTIGQEAFFGCSSLTTIRIHHGVRSIGSYAFQGCSSLKDVMIPESLTHLGTAAYANCTALRAIYAYPPIPVDLTASPEVFAGVNKNNCTLLVPPVSRPQYVMADQWKDFLDILSMELGTEERQVAASDIEYYPNPFTDQITIEALNPSLKEVTVEIFSLTGQKIKTLLQAQKGAKISCTWDGRDDNGIVWPDGMYVVKVNEEVRKVVKD